MEFFETVLARRTVRSYTGAPIPCEDLEKIVDAARLAPSGVNIQPWQFIVVTEPAIMEQLRIPPEHWSKGAGAIIAIVMDPESRWWREDGAAAATTILLACAALGYSGCWMEGYTSRNEAPIRAVLGIPERLKLLTLIPIGVPAEHPEKDKKSLRTVLHWQRYPQLEE